MIKFLKITSCRITMDCEEIRIIFSLSVANLFNCFFCRRAPVLLTSTEGKYYSPLTLLKQHEFEWVLNKEVHTVLNQLKNILVECIKRFPVPLNLSGEGHYKPEKFVLSNGLDQIKCVVSLTGDSITHAEINFKIQRQQMINYRTTVQPDNPWRLHQVQDAVNHLHQAIVIIDNIDIEYPFRSSEEVLFVLGNILGCLQRGRSSLILPRKRTIDDLMKSRNMKSLSPGLPEDLALSFYIQSHKLVFAVYQLSSTHGTMKYECHQSEASVPWLNEVLVLFTVALQLCQQLKDKISVFAQYKDFVVGPLPPLHCNV